MKKLAASMFLGLFWLGNASAPCGWDFAQAKVEGLPPTYCFARQVRGHVTYNGWLNLPCSGDECPVPNVAQKTL